MTINTNPSNQIGEKMVDISNLTEDTPITAELVNALMPKCTIDEAYEKLIERISSLLGDNPSGERIRSLLFTLDSEPEDNDHINTLAFWMDSNHMPYLISLVKKIDPSNFSLSDKLSMPLNHKESTMLMKAVWFREKGNIHLLLSNNAHADAVDANGMNVLHHAAKNTEPVDCGMIETIMTSTNPPDIDARDDDGETALIKVLGRLGSLYGVNSNIEIFVSLLRYNPNLSITDNIGDDVFVVAKQRDARMKDPVFEKLLLAARIIGGAQLYQDIRDKGINFVSDIRSGSSRDSIASPENLIPLLDGIINSEASASQNLSL